MRNSLVFLLILGESKGTFFVIMKLINENKKKISFIELLSFDYST